LLKIELFITSIEEDERFGNIFVFLYRTKVKTFSSTKTLDFKLGKGSELQKSERQKLKRISKI